MRGAELKEIRRQNLVRLRKASSWENIAELSGTNASYLSQIANRVIQKGGKTPRSMSDDYAGKIERGLGLAPGWMDQPHEDGEAPEVNVSPAPRVRGQVPLISWVRAGEWTRVEDPYAVGDAEQWVSCPVSHGPRTFVLRVRGSSMEPDFPDGQWIFVDPDCMPRNGSLVVVRLDGSMEATFKRLVIEGYQQYLEALNPHWPQRIVPINQDAQILGVVIFAGRPVTP